MKKDFIDNELLFDYQSLDIIFIWYTHIYIYMHIYIHGYINVDNCAEVA